MFELKWQNTFTTFYSAVELTATRFQYIYCINSIICEKMYCHSFPGSFDVREIECGRLLSEGDPETTESEGIYPRKNCAQRARDFCWFCVLYF